MTVKELKEKLEIIIMEGKGDYLVFVGSDLEECEVVITDFYKEVYL